MSCLWRRANWWKKALDKARDDSTPSAEFVDASWSARQADAMVAMASSYLSGNAGQTRNTSDDYLVTIHVDQPAIAAGNGRSSLPIESVKRLCCDGHSVVIGEDENGEPLNIGRKTRAIIRHRYILSLSAKRVSIT